MPDSLSTTFALMGKKLMTQLDSWDLCSAAENYQEGDWSGGDWDYFGLIVVDPGCRWQPKGKRYGIPVPL